MLTHRACVMSALNYITSLNVLPTDVYLHTLPMFHANGWGGIWALAGRGGTQVCLRKVEAQSIFELMQRNASRWPVPPHRAGHAGHLCGRARVSPGARRAHRHWWGSTSSGCVT